MSQYCYAINIDAKYCCIFLPGENISSFSILLERSFSLSLSLPPPLFGFLYIKPAQIMLGILRSSRAVYVIKIQHRVEAGGRKYPRTSLKHLGSRRICRERDIEVSSAPILEYLPKINTPLPLFLSHFHQLPHSGDDGGSNNRGEPCPQFAHDAPKKELRNPVVRPFLSLILLIIFSL